MKGESAGADTAGSCMKSRCSCTEALPGGWGRKARGFRILPEKAEGPPCRLSDLIISQTPHFQSLSLSLSLWLSKHGVLILCTADSHCPASSAA